MVNRRDFRAAVQGRTRAPRVVPAFTIQALQENTVVAKPPRQSVYSERPVKAVMFRRYYDQGLFPVAIEVEGGVERLSWKVGFDKIDYQFYLPVFFDGLVEARRPFSFLVEHAIADMLQAEGAGVKVLPLLPQLIVPIKKSLDTRILVNVGKTSRILQHLVRSGNCVGEALVPYFRQILPTLNLFKERNVNCGEEIDYSTQRGDNVADIVQETLEVLEAHGGEDAYINIKYIIPTYESCVKN